MFAAYTQEPGTTRSGRGPRVLLVDPSLFTAPYDAALDAALVEVGVDPVWARRDLRPGEAADLPTRDRDLSFYRLSDGVHRRTGPMWKAIKGIEHALGLWRLIEAARGHDLVHFQWTPLPLLDARAIRAIARERPVVLTLHDTEPFNGATVSPLQRRGFDRVCAAADHLIVHTAGAKAALVARGHAGHRISVIAHGPLPLRATPRPVADKAPGRWRVVLFGRLQAYKGIDVLIEALGRLDRATRARLEVIIAGEALIDLAPLRARIAALGLEPPDFTLRPGRLDDQAMADLLGSADAFVFPYRAIEASGVLFLVERLDRWIIASALGAFAETLSGHPGRGALVPPGDSAALAQALVASIGQAPDPGSAIGVADWRTIGAATRRIYDRLLAASALN